MNVFRELRKIKNRNVIIRSRLLCVFLVMLIMSTYAWFKTLKNFEVTGIRGEVTSWDVEYYVNENFTENVYTFGTYDFYPGMDTVNETVKIYNTGVSDTDITYELLSVKLFGEDILDELKTNSEIIETSTGITLFSDAAKYPFKISYTFDRSKLTGTYTGEGSPATSIATINVNVSWNYNDGTDVKDTLDTSFGERAFSYYKDNPDATEALIIELKITSDKATRN